MGVKFARATVRREGRGRRGREGRAGGLKLEVKVNKVEVQHSLLHIWPGKNEREWKETETKGQNGKKTNRLFPHQWAHFPSFLECLVTQKG